MSISRIIPVISLAVAMAWAQTAVDLKTQVRNADFSGFSATKPAQVGTNLPGSCSTGQLFFKADGAAGGNLYGCVQNAWSLQGGAAALKTLQGTGSSIPTSSGAFRSNAVPTVDASGSQVDSGCSAAGGALTCSSGAPTRIGVTKGAAPSDSLLNGFAYDAVLFLDSIDGNWKMRRQDGSVAPLGGSTVDAEAISHAEYCADASAAVNTITCVTATGFTAYTAGQAILVKAANTNTGATVININSLGPMAVTKSGASALAAGDLASGGMYLLVYDGTRFQAQLGGAGGGTPAAERIRPCEIIIGDPGAASPELANDNDSPGVCGNTAGATMTITAVECYANAGSPTVTPIITGGSATSILSGALTCGAGSFASGSLNGTPTQANGASIDANITTAGGTAKYIVIRITRTL